MRRLRRFLLVGAAALIVATLVYITVFRVMQPPIVPGVTVENFRLIRKGMTPAEVESILGPKNDSSRLRREDADVYIWIGATDRVSMVIKDGQVTSGVRSSPTEYEQLTEPESTPDKLHRWGNGNFIPPITALTTPHTPEYRTFALVRRLGGRVEGDEMPGRPIIRIRLFRITDEELRELVGPAALTDLKSLDLSYDKEITDAALKEVAALKSLQSLDLAFTRISDVRLKELAWLTRLQSLDLSGTQITDAGLKELAALAGLESLAVHRTQITEAGLKELRNALPDCIITSGDDFSK